MSEVINSELHGRFCRQLKAWRQWMGISQSEIARRLKIKPSSVCQLESGRSSPTLDTVESTARALGMEVEDFLFSDPRKLPKRILEPVA